MPKRGVMRFETYKRIQHTYLYHAVHLNECMNSLPLYYAIFHTLEKFCKNDLSRSQVRPVLFPSVVHLLPLFPDPDSLDLWRGMWRACKHAIVSSISTIGRYSPERLSHMKRSPEPEEGMKEGY